MTAWLFEVEMKSFSESRIVIRKGIGGFEKVAGKLDMTKRSQIMKSHSQMIRRGGTEGFKFRVGRI
jgi:hypothetical protein